MHQLIRHATLYAFSAAVLRLAGFALLMWLAHSLPVEGYAEFGLLYALQTGLATLALAGVIEMVVGLLNENNSAAARERLYAEGNAAFLSMVFPAAVLSTVLFVLLAGASSQQLPAMGYAVLSGALMAYASLQAQMIRLQERHWDSLAFSFGVPAAGLIGSLVAFAAHGSVESFLLGSAIGLTSSLIVLRLRGIGSFGRTPFAGARRILFGVVPFVIIAFFGWLSGYGNNYLVQLSLDAEEIARFTFALTLASTLQLVATALNQVWAPRFFRLSAEIDSRALEQQNRSVFRFQAVVLGAVGGLVVAVFPAAMSLIGGNLAIYGSMYLEITVLFAAHVLLVPWWQCHNYFLVRGKGRELLAIVLVTSVIGIFAWFALMQIMGGIGVYIGFLLQMLLRAAGIVFVARKHWPVTIPWDGVAAGMLLTAGGFAVSAAYSR